MQDVAQWALFALCSLCYNDDMLKKIGQQGGCVSVGRALVKHVSSAAVSQWACHAVSILASSPENCILFEEMSVCRAVVNALNKHLASEDVVEEACSAIGALAKTCDKNRNLLASAGACEYICKVFKKHLANEMVVEKACYAASVIAADRDQISARLVSAGICRLIGKAFASFYNNEEISGWALQCIVHLGSSKYEGTNALKEFGSADVCRTLFFVIERHYNSLVLVELFLKAVVTMASIDSNVKKLNATDILNWLVRLMDHCIEEETVVTLGCHALGELATDRDSAEKLGSLRACEIITNILVMHRENELVMSWACRAAGRLASYSKRNSARLGEANAAGALAVVLNLHMDRELVCNFVCLAISGMTISPSGNSINRSLLGDLGVCELVLRVLQRYEESESVVAEGLCALSGLVDCNASNLNKCVAHNICKVIVSALSRYNARKGGESTDLGNDDLSQSVVQWGCWIISRMLLTASLSSAAIKFTTSNSDLSNMDVNNICDSIISSTSSLVSAPTTDPTTDSMSVGNGLSTVTVDKESLQSAFAEEGVCEAVTAALLMSGHNLVITEHAINAVQNLANGSTENVLRFVSLSIGDVVCRAVDQHSGSETIILAGLQALVSFKYKNSVLSCEFACRLVPFILQRYMSNHQLIEWCCRLICAMCKGYRKSGNSSANRDMLGVHGACEIIVACLDRHTSSESALLISSSACRNAAAEVVQWVCMAIYALGHEHAEHQEILGKCGACEVVGRAVSGSNNGFAHSEIAAYAGCQAICALAKNNRKHQIALGAAGACSSVVEALHMHPGSVTIGRWGLLAVAVLAENSESNAAKFGDSGAPSTIPVSMHAHQVSAFVALSGCAAIKSIANVSMSYTSQLGQYGACECVVSALQVKSLCGTRINTL